MTVLVLVWRGVCGGILCGVAVMWVLVWWGDGVGVGVGVVDVKNIVHFLSYTSV